ncbi:MAG TPA: dTDP-4-dehydrorhamnose 3,5-epimerase [Polyangiaceae bacterium]|nr:dTDP-4-dehydrorhamnose 3,5-epimerase [Polyangiaceae bacterium]
MIFIPTKLRGATVVDLEPRADERGFFARTFCEREFSAQGLPSRFPQENLSRNLRAKTLRGMHFQLAPFREAKLVRAVSGAIYDVIVDLRPDSPTHLDWFGVELSAKSGRALFVPESFAHGFITLADDTDVAYLMTEFFRPEGATGMRWNDPLLAGIEWPATPAVIAARDAEYPDFDPKRVEV